MRVPDRRELKPLLITAAVLIGLIAANFVVVWVAQSRISGRLSCRFGTAADVGVTVAGGWNGLRVLTGGLGSVDVDVKNATAGPATADFTASVSDVRLDGDALVSGGGGLLSATIGFPALSRMIAANGGRQVEVKSYGEQLMISTGGQVALLSTVSVGPRLLRITPAAVLFGERRIDIERARTLIQQRNPEGADVLGVREIPITQLGDTAQLTSAQVKADGLTVAVALSPFRLAKSAQQECKR